MKYVLITGGATGLGRSFANGFADLGYNLIITSRNFDNLALAKKEIELKYSNKVQIFVADLTDKNARKSLYEYTSHYNLEVLINNAGVGYSESFYDGEKEKEANIIDLNVIAFEEVFKHYYQVFVDKKGGRIINVSSLSSFIPGAYSATYSASKAFVTNLSLAVREEAKKHNVIVQTLAPGSFKSNFYKTAGTKKNSYKANPNRIARKAIESKKGLIIPGFKSKWIYFLTKILPKSFLIKLSGVRQKSKKEK